MEEADENEAIVYADIGESAPQRLKPVRALI